MFQKRPVKQVRNSLCAPDTSVPGSAGRSEFSKLLRAGGRVRKRSWAPSRASTSASESGKRWSPSSSGPSLLGEPMRQSAAAMRAGRPDAATRSPALRHGGPRGLRRVAHLFGGARVKGGSHLCPSAFAANGGGPASRKRLLESRPAPGLSTRASSRRSCGPHGHLPSC
jgi:hypothetical protein